MIYELECQYDTRKSFYGKAKVEEQEDNICKNLKLYSYDALVAIITYDKVKPLVQYNYFGNYSQTTTRHQKEFFKQNGLNDKEIKELFKNGILEKEAY